jgi:hypothetical protein
MKTLLILTTIATGIMIASTLICGLWLRFSAGPVEQSSINFHMGIALATIIVTALTLVLAVSGALKNLA